MLLRLTRPWILRGPALFVLLVLLPLLSACEQAPIPQAGPGKILVVATTTQIRSMAESVAGDLATVHSILTPGADPHEFEPRPSDVRAVAGSDLILKNSLGLDDWLDKILYDAGNKRPPVTVTSGIPIRKGDESDPKGDPHVWFSALNAITMTLNIRDALVSVDPSHSATYRSNASAYIQKLHDLDKYITGQVATVPLEQRKMVTNHDAIGYYTERYGLTFVGSIIPSMSSEAQPSAQDLADLTRKIKEQHVKAIFLENSINPRLAEQIAHDAGVKIVTGLYGDALGEPSTPAGTYEGMMRYNTDLIVSALK